MKIAILTFHRAYNCGAMLQAWALKETLTDMGHFVFFVDFGVRDESYRWRLKQLHWNGLWNSAKSIIKSLMHDLMSIGVVSKYRKSYGNFCHYYLPERNLKDVDFRRDCDVVVVGSDQVWNIPLVGSFAPLLLGESIPPEVPIIGYSISIGDNPPTQENRLRILRGIDRFSNVSMREDLLIEALGMQYKKTLPCTLDPLLLRKSDELIKISKVFPSLPSEYVYCYTISIDEHVMDFAKRFAESVNLPLIVSPNYVDSRFKAPKGLLMGVGPSEMVSLTGHAKYVITTSFHGTATAFILGKMFVSVCLSDKVEDSRQYKFLKRLGLENKVVTLDSDRSRVCAALSEPIRSECLALWEELKGSSLSYIRGSLQKIDPGPVVEFSYEDENWSETAFQAAGGYVAVLLNYNKKGLIEKACRGAFTQDFPCYEILCMDDCSTDGSYEEMLQAAQKYARERMSNPDGRVLKLRVVRNYVNRSTLKQWKIAHSISTAKWFGMFCGDDVSYSNRIAVADRYIKLYPTVVALCTNAEGSDGHKIVSYDDLRIWNGTDALRPFVHIPGCTAFWRRDLLSPDFPCFNMDDIVIYWCALIDHFGESGAKMLWCFNETTIYYSIGTGISTDLEYQATRSKNWFVRQWQYAKADREKGRKYGYHTFDIIRQYDKRFGRDNLIRQQLYGRYLQARMESAGWLERLIIFWKVCCVERRNDYGGMRPVVEHYVLVTFVWYFGGRPGYLVCAFLNRIKNHYKRLYDESRLKRGVQPVEGVV